MKWEVGNGRMDGWDLGMGPGDFFLRDILSNQQERSSYGVVESNY